MFGKKKLTVSVCCISTMLLVAPIAIACEPEEETPKKEEIKECDESSEVEESASVSSLLDLILDRYPLLNRIIQLLLEFMYTWLSSANFSLG